MPPGSDPLRRRQSHAPRPARQLEHTLARLRRCQLEHLLRDLRAAFIDVGRVIGPRTGDSGPHAVQVHAEVIEISTLCARSTIRPFHDALRFHERPPPN